MSKSETAAVTPEAAKALDPEALVSFTAPMDPTGASQDILLGVNGQTIRIQRGATVQIPRKYVEVWENSVAQVNEAIRAQAAAQKQSKTPLDL